MTQGKYLNFILTVNAVLLAVLIWTQLVGGPALVSPAAAQQVKTDTTGVPDAGAQRQKMIDALRDIKKAVEANKQLLESGKVRVEVTNLDQITVQAASRK